MNPQNQKNDQLKLSFQNINEENNEKNNITLLDQKRNRILSENSINDSDIEMNKTPLSSLNMNHPKINFFPNIPQILDKKMSIDLNENQNNNFQNNKNEIGDLLI